MLRKDLSLMLMIVITTSVFAVAFHNVGQQSFQSISDPRLSSSLGGLIYVDDDGLCGGNSPCYTTIQGGVNAASNGDTIYVYAGTYYEHVIISKSLTLQGENRDTTVINAGDTGAGIYVETDYVNITGFTIFNAGFGMQIWYSANVVVKGNKISTNFTSQWGHGIHLFRSTNIAIIGNNISKSGEGIYIQNSANTTVMDNKISSNKGEGLRFWVSTNVTIKCNHIWDNLNGIRLFYSDNNIITGNTVSLNYKGFWLQSNNNNVIYHNNIINNTNQAIDQNPGGNNWHHPVLLEGNYWSDYAGLDDGSGTGKHAIAGDGIGDTMIPHPGIGYDFYPLMNPWTCLMTISAVIDIDPDTLNLRSMSKWITCYIELPEGYDVADIDIGTILLNGVVPAEEYPTYIGDYDSDGIPDLMVKFDHSEVVKILEPGDDVVITIAGKVGQDDFQGSDIIRVIDKGKNGSMGFRGFSSLT